jgi:hypothetical protein
MKLSYIFESPENLFKAAEERGILRLIYGDEEFLDCQFEGKIQQIRIQILQPKNWLEFLNTISRSTKNESEFEFVNDLIKQFNLVVSESGKSINDFDEIHKQKSEITDKQIEDLKQIKTVDELINKIENGTL